MAVHAGSWFGLPDFGLTEKLQSIVAPQRPLTPQGGSNLFGPVKAPAQASGGGGQTLGVQYARPAGPSLPASSGGGYSGPQSSGAAPTAQSAPQNAPYESAPQAPSIDFDALIAPALDALNQTESAAQSGYGSSVSQIEQGAQTQKAGAQTAQTTANTQLDQRKATATSSAEGAINESRRAAAELQQGLGARYGTGVSTGLGASAILGAQSVRDISHMRANLQQALNEVETARTGVTTTYNNALKEIDAQTQTLKQQAQATLQNNLASIGQQRGALQSKKAELVYNAMEQYRQEINAVNQRNTAFQQQITQQAQQAHDKLTEIQTQAQNKVASLKGYQPVTNSLTGDMFSFNPNTGDYTSANPTGAVTSNPQGQDNPLNPTGVGTLSPDEQQYLNGL